MNRRSLLPLLVLGLLMGASVHAAVGERLLNPATTPMTSGGSSSTVDVPAYRVGDEWVYETQFDIATLLAQANVSATLNTLTGDTTNEVTDIVYITEASGQTVLAYEVNISGAFTSANSNTNCGATVEVDGVNRNGRIDIDYTGTDQMRVRDLGLMNSTFNLRVEFIVCLFGVPSSWITGGPVVLGDVTFYNSYTPAKERHDFPLRNGDQWSMAFTGQTSADGTSDYFDPSEFDATTAENNSWQVVKAGAPTEDGDTPQYSGCDDSYKISEWNATGVNVGFNWYCPEVRGTVWNRVINPAGFTIDWILKTYTPADSNSVDPASDAGGRNTVLEVTTGTLATLPDAVEQIYIDYSVASSPPLPIKNTNLQLRYEVANTILNPTTDNNGQAQIGLNVSDQTDDTAASDDHTSNGVVVYDPVNKVVGTVTVVQDLSVVGVDLIAQSASVIVERTRGGITSTLGAAIGYNALPGDVLTFSLPAQNRGVLTAPATVMEVETPDGSVARYNMAEVEPYAEQRVLVNWTVPAAMPIGTASLMFEVDPDENVTADANRSNNDGAVAVFIGRAPTGNLTTDDPLYTYENVTLNATGSFDEDGGSVECRFEIESRAGLVEVIEAPGCWTQWNWSDSGMWTVNVLVIDEELDIDDLSVEIEILNRAPTFDLVHAPSVYVESPITVQAVNISDIDTTSPSGQQVSVSWPGLDCSEGLTQANCTFTPTQEGPMDIMAVATDDDGDETTHTTTIDVLNVAPTLDYPTLTVAGEEQQPDSEGHWNIDEDEIGVLGIQASDTANDQGTVIVQWFPSADEDQNWTVQSVGANALSPVAWNMSGLHRILVQAYDADGATSELREAYINVHNVPPTVSQLPVSLPVFEDEVLNLTVTADDTASDLDELRICWDLDSTDDSDNDGVRSNDCDEEGNVLSTSWSTRGVRWVTVNVIDDDGAVASASTNISVINLPPTPVISLETEDIELVEGDNLTLSALESVETEGDKANLVYRWDSNHLDFDGDGDAVGDTDHTGPTWTMQNLPPGDWTVTLTVQDDDGESKQTTFSFSVAERPPEGIFESVSETLGTTMTLVIFALGFVIIGLVAFLLFTRGSKSDDTMAVLEAQGFQPAVAGSAFGSAPSAPVKSLPAVPTPTPAPAQPVYASGPPLPASGLPPGWTMEQWQHYGQQWLDSQPAPAPAAAAPMAAFGATLEPVQQPVATSPPPQPQQTAPTPASAELQSLLDDLEF